MTRMPRHGRLGRRGPVQALLAIIGALAAVVLVSTTSVAAVVTWQLASSFEPGVDLGSGAVAPPSVGAIEEPVNILLVGSDSGDGNAVYGDRGENLNDVTILIHISPVSHSAVAVSLQRDMFVPITGDGCTNHPGTRKINEALANGGLACAVSTVEALTGLDIGYAAKIEFDGVIAMSDAVGGVEVCVAVPIHDLQIGFNLDAGNHTLQGWDALQFLRSRHGVGDGSDTTRVSNQQLFLSALMRKIKSEDTLGNPVTIYSIAQAAASNMQLSTSLSIPAMASIALALKDIPLANISFVSYPASATQMNGVGGVAPRTADARVLMDAIRADARVDVTGDPGGGAIAGEDVPEPTPTPSATATPGDGGTSTGSDDSGSSSSDSGDVVALPPSINGQDAAEQTCTNGNTF